MSKKPSSHEFKQFQDEPSPDEASEIEEQQRRKKKEERKKQLTRVLIIGAIGIGIIFAIMVNTFSHNTQHAILDDSDPKYTYIQTVFPHIKVKVSKQADTYESKMVRLTGVVFSEVVAWIEGNVAPGWKVLFVPNEGSGVNMLGMAIGYYLQERLQGRLDIIIATDAYREMTKVNLQLMQKQHVGRFPVKLLFGSEELSKDYDLVLIENNNFHRGHLLTWAQTFVVVSKGETDDILFGTYSTYSKQQISKGIINDKIKTLGLRFGYSLAPYSSSSQGQYRSIVLKKSKDLTINECEQNQQIFKSFPQNRNLLQFLRNKTIGVLRYCGPAQLSDTLGNLTSKKEIVIYGKDEDISSKMNEVSPIDQDYLVVPYSQAMGLVKKPLGVLVVSVSDMQQAENVRNKFASSVLNIVAPYNNDGCFYPPNILSYHEVQFSRPFWIVIRDPYSADDSN